MNSLKKNIKKVIPEPVTLGYRAFINFFNYIFNPNKTVVLIMSSQRSGSTLLKSLLAEAEDISHLPEISYWKNIGNKYDLYARACKLAKERIVVLKSPFHSSILKNEYIIDDMERLKIIILVRHIYGVVDSMLRMDQKVGQKAKDQIARTKTYIKYWTDCYQKILNVAKKIPKKRIKIVKYEDLLTNPIKETKDLFQYLGSRQLSGVDTYHKPKDFEWNWGIDDGS